MKLRPWPCMRVFFRKFLHKHEDAEGIRSSREHTRVVRVPHKPSRHKSIQCSYSYRAVAKTKNNMANNAAWTDGEMELLLKVTDCFISETSESEMK